MKIKNFLIKQFYLIELGKMFLLLGAFIFTGISASNQIIDIFKKLTGLTLSMKSYIILVFIGGTFGIWALGYLLDKIKYAHGMYYEMSKRNPIMTEILERVKKIERRE